MNRNVVVSKAMAQVAKRHGLKELNNAQYLLFYGEIQAEITSIVFDDAVMWTLGAIGTFAVIIACAIILSGV